MATVLDLSLLMYVAPNVCMASTIKERSRLSSEKIKSQLKSAKNLSFKLSCGVDISFLDRLDNKAIIYVTNVEFFKSYF